MRKPVLFYQFDESEFRQKQYGEGYLSYHDTVLGRWFDDKDELFTELEKSMAQNFPLIDEEISKSVFPNIDQNNSERVYNAIKSLEK